MTCWASPVTLGGVALRQRLDGRQLLQHREATIQFGRTHGTCQVRLGNTRVLASVTAELGAPRPARPTEGTLQVAVHVSQTSAAGADRSGQLSVALERLLERCLRESRCVDVESLCVVADETVWQLRLQVQLLDDSGAAADAAALAALAALCHFRRPYVSVEGGEVRVRPPDQFEPVPLAVLHTPLLATFAFFCDGEHMVADPTEVEERAMDGRLTVGINSYREMCTLHLTGKLLLNKHQVMHCTELAAARVKALTLELRRALADDKSARTVGAKIAGLAALQLERVATATAAVRLSGVVRPGSLSPERMKQIEHQVDEQLQMFRNESTSVVGGGGASSWLDNDDDEMWPPQGDALPSHAKPEPDGTLTGRAKPEPEADSDGEEVTVLRPEDLEPAADTSVANRFDRLLLVR